jgi:hypothetical protein
MSLDILRTIVEMESFLNGSQAIAYTVASSKRERTQWWKRSKSLLAMPN